MVSTISKNTTPQRTKNSFLMSANIAKPTFSSKVKQDFSMDSHNIIKTIEHENRQLIRSRTPNKSTILGCCDKPDLFQVQMSRGRNKQFNKNKSTLIDSHPDIYERSFQQGKKIIKYKNEVTLTRDVSAKQLSKKHVASIKTPEKYPVKRRITSTSFITTFNIKNQSEQQPHISPSVGKKVFKPQTKIIKAETPLRRQFPNSKQTEAKSTLQPDLHVRKYSIKGVQDIGKMLAQQDMLYLAKLNKAATSKHFNPKRTSSSIDFACSNQCLTPRPLRRQLKNKPEDSIKDCFQRSISPVPKNALLNSHKITEQDPNKILVATRLKVREFNKENDLHRLKSRSISADLNEVGIGNEAQMQKPKFMNQGNIKQRTQIVF